MKKIYAIKSGNNELWIDNLQVALKDFETEMIYLDEKFENGDNDQTDIENLTLEIKYVTQEKFDEVSKLMLQKL